MEREVGSVAYRKWRYQRLEGKRGGGGRGKARDGFVKA